jgi:hypothetical protein
MFPQVASLLGQVLLHALHAGLWSMGPVSLDGTKIHADASKHAAVSYDRCLELMCQLLSEIKELTCRADQGTCPAGLDIAAEIQRRLLRLAQLAKAREVIEQRAAEREIEEQAAYAAKLADREERARCSGKKPRGKPPTPPTPGARATDQYNFTDPESRIMKKSTDAGFEQQYNAQLAVEQQHGLIVAYSLSNHPNDQAEALPTLQAIAADLGTPSAAALDTGYFSAANVEAIEQAGITPYIAIGKDAHHTWLKDFCATSPEPPPADASPKRKMAYQLQTAIGHAIYRLRKCTVEPVIGIVKETLGFRQFSLRGLEKVTGELGLIALAFDLKRLSVLQASAGTEIDAQKGHTKASLVALAHLLLIRWSRQGLDQHARKELFICQSAS